MTSASRSKGEDVAAVAAGLTKAKRFACLNMTDAWGLAPYDGRRRAGQACSALCRLGLADRASPGIRFSDAPAYRLTALGLAVRAHLTDQEGQNR